MKTVIFILLFCLLLQSCTAYYKTIDPEKTPLVEKEHYKIKQRHRFVKVQLLQLKSTTIIVLENDKQRKIVTSDIRKIKVRKPTIIKKIYDFPAKFMNDLTEAFEHLY